MFRRALPAALCGLLVLAAPVSAEAEEDEEEEEELWTQLTEREDKRRPLEPFSVEVAGHPLVLGGEYEVEFGYVRRRFLDEDSVDQPDRFLMEQGLTAEAFYTIGPPLSIFLQVQGVLEEDLLGRMPREVSNLFVERGEMWLYSENIFGTHVNFDIGRLDFEDERRWWWEDEIDAVRLEYERETFDLALALAYELASDNTDQSAVDPDEKGVLRVIGELGWDWIPNHTLELFLLHQNDRSPTEKVGDLVDIERADDEDGRLTWLGARLLGIFELGAPGYLGYWLDAALVRGDEELLELADPEDPERADKRLVEAITDRDVSGWGVDVGLSWILPVAYEPRVFGGYAYGSGDSDPETGTDHNFRQTGLQANEAGFGGVERFVSYGVLLAPELSNLEVLTAGAGLSLFRSSSLDLVYHHYWLVEPTGSLNVRLRGDLTEEDRDVGDEVDLVLALEEWERLEFTIIASAFRAGRAFEPENRAWSVGGFFAVRFAF